MDMADLIKDFRIVTQDKVAPFLFTNDDVMGWMIEAEQEACIRGRLIHEADNQQICRIPLVANQANYKLHRTAYEIDYLAYTRPGYARQEPVKLVSREWLDANRRDWRECSGVPEYAVQNDTSLRLSPTPNMSDGVLLLEAYRLPLRGLCKDLNSIPEIHIAHHHHLVDWALSRAFALPDSDTLDLGRAKEFEDAFTNYFGLRPDSDLRRITRHDTPHFNVAAWP